MLRKNPFASLLSKQSSGEPVIVVDEPTSVITEEDEETLETHTKDNKLQSQLSEDMDSPMQNPYLLSPWRDPRETRKHSLPTPSCTTGITASQVRRLSEQGSDKGLSPNEQAFLATLHQAPTPTPGGRRHSVVTISKVPSALFGRNRRESIAVLPTGKGIPSKSGSRRESQTSLAGPPSSTDLRGSLHNLELDIMDDIVNARKSRLKAWNTSKERLAEMLPLSEVGSGAPTVTTPRFNKTRDRRYSDFFGVGAPNSGSIKRRASEYPGLSASTTAIINAAAAKSSTPATTPSSNKSMGAIKKSPSIKDKGAAEQDNQKSSSSWFGAAKRQPPAKPVAKAPAKTPMVSYLSDKFSETKKELGKALWDEKPSPEPATISGAFDTFLGKGGSGAGSSMGAAACLKSVVKSNIKSMTKSTKPQQSTASSSWFGGGNKSNQSDESKDLEAGSICSTLKDLFVK